MKQIVFMVTGLCFFLSHISIANAHIGHLGELAGHSHWVGLGAVVLAGAIAAVVGKLSDKEQETSEEPDAEPVEEMA